MRIDSLVTRAAEHRSGCKGALMRIREPLWALWDGQPVNRERPHWRRMPRVSQHQCNKEYNETS
eukprot:3869582-Pyramimonas_sp.AAC.1